VNATSGEATIATVVSDTAFQLMAERPAVASPAPTRPPMMA
jgi:hypothetical protein